MIDVVVGAVDFSSWWSTTRFNQEGRVKVQLPQSSR